MARQTADRRRRRVAHDASAWDDVAALEASIAGARAARLSGLDPSEPRRDLFPHERLAAFDGRRLDAAVRTVARQLAEALEEDRATFLELLADDLDGRAPAEVVDRLLDIDGPVGLADVDGVTELLDEAERRYLDLLGLAWAAGAEAAEAEAGAQGVDPAAVGLPDPAIGGRQLEQLARRLASGPLVDLVRILREAAVAAPTA